MDRLEEINQEYAQWQKELSIREMKLRPSYFIEKDTDRTVTVQATSDEKTKKNKKTGEMEPQFKIKNLFPGYVFVKMIMTDEAWYMVRNTPLVTGIAGSSGGGQKPSPVSYKEMERVLKRIGIVEDSMYSKYHVGDQVKIIHGAFVGMSCTIRSIDKENNTVQVEALFFGRKTLLDIDFKEIIKE